MHSLGCDLFQGDKSLIPQCHPLKHHTKYPGSWSLSFSMLYVFPLCSTIFFYMIFQATTSDFNNSYSFCHLLKCSAGNLSQLQKAPAAALSLVCSHLLGPLWFWEFCCFPRFSSWGLAVIFLSQLTGTQLWLLEYPKWQQNHKKVQQSLPRGGVDTVLSSSLPPLTELYT